MNFTAFAAMVRRDLRLFFLDKRAMIMSFAAPIAIASFFGYLFQGVPSNEEPAKISVIAIDQDGSAVSKRCARSAGGTSAPDPTHNLRYRRVSECRTASRRRPLRRAGA